MYVEKISYKFDVTMSQKSYLDDTAGLSGGVIVLAMAERAGDVSLASEDPCPGDMTFGEPGIQTQKRPIAHFTFFLSKLDERKNRKLKKVQAPEVCHSQTTTSTANLPSITTSQEFQRATGIKNQSDFLNLFQPPSCLLQMEV
jgi:hypothetical protein